MYQRKSPELFLRQKGNQQKRSNNAQMFVIQTLSAEPCRRSLVAQQKLALLGPKHWLYTAHAHTWFLSKDVRILRFGSELQWSQKVVSGYSFPPTKVHMSRESTVSNEKDKTALFLLHCLCLQLCCTTHDDVERSKYFYLLLLPLLLSLYRKVVDYISLVHLYCLQSTTFRLKRCLLGFHRRCLWPFWDQHYRPW